jgi:type I restriction enzyme S subunit
MNISENGEFVWEGTKYVSEEVFAEHAEYALKAGDVLFNNTNSKELVGKTCYIESDIRGGFSNHMTRLRPDPKRLHPRLLAFLLHSMWRRGVFLSLCHKWVGQAGVNNTILADLEIPLPPLAVQRQIVAELEAERALVEANRELAARFERKLQASVAAVWGAPSEASAPSDPSDSPP